MNIPEYNTDLANVFSNLAYLIPGNNESSHSTDDYFYDSREYNMSYTGGSQHLESILQQLFSKMSDNETASSVSLSSLSTGMKFPSSLSLISTFPSSSNDANSFRILSFISLWFVLIINPIVVKKKFI
jgi:hypothetical protein